MNWRRYKLCYYNFIFLLYLKTRVITAKKGRDHNYNYFPYIHDNDLPIKCVIVESNIEDSIQL